MCWCTPCTFWKCFKSLDILQSCSIWDRLKFCCFHDIWAHYWFSIPNCFFVTNELVLKVLIRMKTFPIFLSCCQCFLKTHFTFLNHISATESTTSTDTSCTMYKHLVFVVLFEGLFYKCIPFFEILSNILRIVVGDVIDKQIFYTFACKFCLGCWWNG